MSEAPNDSPFVRVAGPNRSRGMKGPLLPKRRAAKLSEACLPTAVRGSMLHLHGCVSYCLYGGRRSMAFVASYRHRSSKDAWVVWQQAGSTSDLEIVGEPLVRCPEATARWGRERPCLLPFMSTRLTWCPRRARRGSMGSC